MFTRQPPPNLTAINHYSDPAVQQRYLTWQHLEATYPRYPKEELIVLTDEERYVLRNPRMASPLVLVAYLCCVCLFSCVYVCPHGVAGTCARSECWLDLRPYMNRTIHTVNAEAPIGRAFRLFRTLGLRQLVVVRMGWRGGVGSRALPHRGA